MSNDIKDIKSQGRRRRRKRRSPEEEGEEEEEKRVRERQRQRDRQTDRQTDKRQRQAETDRQTDTQRIALKTFVMVSLSPAFWGFGLYNSSVDHLSGYKSFHPSFFCPPYVASLADLPLKSSSSNNKTKQ